MSIFGQFLILKISRFSVMNLKNYQLYFLRLKIFNKLFLYDMFYHSKEFPNKSNIVRKVSRYGVFSSSHFPVFGMKTEIYSLNTEKHVPEKIPYLNIFHAVQLLGNTLQSIALTLLGKGKKKVDEDDFHDIQFKISRCHI